jgi:transposase-like protein
MRKRYTSKQREQLIEAVRTSGESVRAVATQMGVTASTAYLWMKDAPTPSVPQFARLVPEPRAALTSLVVRVGSVAIRVDQGFDAELLRAVVSALTTRTT